MRILISFQILLFIFINDSYSQNTDLKSKYSGHYILTNTNELRNGSVQIYIESDSTFLFYLDLNSGESTFNMGNLYGRLIIKNDIGRFVENFKNGERICELIFHFSKDKLTINYSEDKDDCGFGNSVYANGVYKLKSKNAQNYFIDLEGKKIYFHEISPDEYYKN